MRYRIVIEVDTDQPQSWVNNLAMDCSSEVTTRFSNPVYVATELVSDKQRYVMVKKD